MSASRTASADNGMISVRPDGVDASDFAELRAHTRARAAISDVTATTAEKQSQEARMQLQEIWKAPERQGYGKVRR
jgi:hypothetical protein